MREPAGQTPVVSNNVPAHASTRSAENERVLLLEIRMEKLASALAEAGVDAIVASGFVHVEITANSLPSGDERSAR